MTARFKTAPAALLLMAAAFAPAAAARADTAPALGPRYGGMFDVSFKPFADAKSVDRQVGGEIVRFEDAGKRWTLSFARSDLGSPQEIKDTRDPHNASVPGYLTNTVNQLRSTTPNADVMRNEVVDLGDLQVGVLVVKTADKGQPTLLQEAFIQISQKIYYSIAMTSPCPDKDIGNDPAVIEAGQTFKAIIDSIERVDLSGVREDQDDRLIRTRALFVNWSEKHLVEALQPERFLLFKRDGQPIGYAYVVEQPADSVPRPGEVEKGAVLNAQDANGFRVGMRTHVLSDAGKTVDSESWMYSSFDRRHEVWSSVTIMNDPNGKSEKEKQNWFSEVGASDLQRERVFDRDLKSDDFKDMDAKSRKDKNAGVPFREVDKYRLTVRTEGRSAVAEPIERALPPFYIPQAIAMQLPRIVPLNNPTGYMFASYSADNRQVMLRYLDVKTETDVKVNGRVQRAIPIVDRIGLQGEPTTHYMSAAGEYLGTINESTKLEIDPATRESIAAAFKDANLTLPDPVKN